MPVELSAEEPPDTFQEYQISHPSAQVNGILKGTYYGTISDQISITCRGGSEKTRLRAVIDYKDEVKAFARSVTEY